MVHVCGANLPSLPCAGARWQGELSLAATYASFPVRSSGQALRLFVGIELRRAVMFALDSRLQQDCLQIGDFPLCRLLLMNDSNYPWFILVPRREEVSELFQLDAADQRQFWHETTLLAETLKDTFAADKMNVAALGNVVSQLHMHVIVRRRDDVAWPAPVWGKHPAQPYSDEQVSRLTEKLRLVLTEDFRFAGDQA